MNTLLNRPSKHTAANISRQILHVFVIQMLFISLITVLGVIIAAKVVEGVMMEKALEGEAQHFWNRRAQNPAHPAPNTDNLYAYFISPNEPQNLPAALTQAELGLQRMPLNGSEPLIYVDKQGDDTLYLVFDEQSVSSLSFYFGVVPLSLALIILYISAWFAYRKSQQALSPLVQLAHRLQNFDIEKGDLTQLNLSELNSGAGNNEMNILIHSLDSFTNRITQLVNRERTFTQDASHELRTPLTIIQGASQWLLKQPLEPQQTQNVERILRTSRDMSIIVNALLLLARGQFAHNLDDNKQAVNVNRLTQGLIVDLQTSHNRHQTVTVDFVEQQQLHIEASPEALKIVISNLLRNAFNYSFDDIIHIFIRDNALYVQNRIKQPQIEPLETLFQPFVRGQSESLNDPSDNRVDGHGVGLDIVKRLCDICGWQIEVHYAKKDGIEFCLRLR